MKIVYCSCVCSEETYKKLFAKSGNMPGQQVQKYNRVLLNGLAKQENIHIEAISKLPINSSNTSKKIVKIESEIWNSIKIQYLPFVNIPKFSNFFQILFAFFAILKISKKEELVVALDVLNISMGLGIIFGCKIKKIPVIGIVTDLPEYLDENPKSSFVCQCKRIIAKCSSYVVLTEAMNDSINPKRQKKYVVIEGQVDSAMASKDNLIKNKYNTKVCIYSGSLDRCNGIQYLVEGFLKANISDTELHVYGVGDYVPELEKICAIHVSVKYFGMRLNDEVVKAQTKATLLINPRPTNQEFTKYSFPSKNMEYMASGTPVLTTKLPGMPVEYYDYVYILEEETSEGMGEKLCEILGKTKEELHEKGADAKEFVLQNKTDFMQAKKIIEMIQSS